MLGRPRELSVHLPHLSTHLTSPCFRVQDKLNLAQALSSQVNRGYQALFDPLSRAEYILQQHGVEISEIDTLDDDSFILDIMNIREAVDDASDNARLQELAQQNDGMFFSVSLL